MGRKAPIHLADRVFDLLMQKLSCSAEAGAAPDMRQVLAASLLAELTQRQARITHILSPRIHGQRRGLSDKAEHIRNEADIYIQVLFRPVELTSNVAQGGRRADLTNLHLFLLEMLAMLLPEQPASLIRLKPVETALDDGIVPLFGWPQWRHSDAVCPHLQQRLYALFRAEHARLRLVLGSENGAGRFATSRSWILGKSDNGNRPEGTWGYLHLQIGAMLVPVPEELSLPDVLDCLSRLLASRLHREALANAVAADRGDGASGMVAEADAGRIAARERQEAEGEEAADGSDRGTPSNAEMTAGYRLYKRFCNIMVELNRPYGNMVMAGLASDTMFRLPTATEPELEVRFSGGDCAFLRDLRENAQARRKADGRSHLLHDDWRNAWEEMAGKNQIPRKFKSAWFAGFMGSPEGHDLMGTVLAALPPGDMLDDGGQDNEAGEPPGVIAPLAAGEARRTLEERVLHWRATCRLDVCQFAVLDWMMSAKPGRGRWIKKNDEDGTLLISDPVLRAKLPDLLQRTLPYSLIKMPGAGAADHVRLTIFKFFLERNLKLLTERMAIEDDEAMTLAEERMLMIVQQVNREWGATDRAKRSSEGDNQVEMLHRMENDRELARLLGKSPYRVIKDPDVRLQVALNFYVRDVEWSWTRPA